MPHAEALAGLKKEIEHKIETRSAALESSIARLEDGRLRFMGVHEPGFAYAPGMLVTRSGGLWHCNEVTREQPGRSNHWTLAVKSGAISKGPTLR